MEQIVDYIKNTYEFEIEQGSIPASEFQYIKRNFYIWIMNSVSKKLFYFLRDKVSPIKFLEERPDGSVWLRKRMSVGKLCEIKVIKLNVYERQGNTTYSIRLFFDLDDFFIPVKSVGNTGLYEEIKLEKLDTILIDKHLCQITELKEFSRNLKIKNILK